MSELKLKNEKVAVVKVAKKTTHEFINHNQDKTMSYDESFTVY
jgi:hypothetical protein